MIGLLERVPLREVWRHEALDFTRWLVENPDVLSEIIGISLTSLAREQAAGAFAADITGETDGGGVVVVENQLERSDHDHLGKLVTYVAALGARTAIWITADPRPEHIGAVTWLNEGGTADFYIVKLEAVKIGDSAPAPLLTLIAGPSKETLDVGETKKELAARFDEREAFWQSLLKVTRERTRLFSTISANGTAWLATGAGKSGLLYVLRVRQTSAAVEFSIERPSPEENKAAFERLQKEKEAIEAAFGGVLEWQQRSGRRGSFWVGKTIEAGGYRNPDRFGEAHDQLVDALIRLERAVAPYIDKLGLSS